MAFPPPGWKRGRVHSGGVGSIARTWNEGPPRASECFSGEGDPPSPQPSPTRETGKGDPPRPNPLPEGKMEPGIHLTLALSPRGEGIEERENCVPSIGH